MRSGIIPVMVHPDSGCVYVLLGRNRTAESYPGSNAWSDFGGYAKVGESPESCAAREIAEESLETLVKYHERHIMERALTDGQYIFKREDPNSNILWFVKFKWNPAALFEFGSIYKLLSTMSKVCKQYILTNSEKNILKKYRWFCKDKRLNDVLQHPAIVHKEQILTPECISQAQAAFASHAQMAVPLPYTNTKPSLTRIISEVKSHWLEKDSLQLFSIPQLCAMICDGSVSCSKGTCSQLDQTLVAGLTHFLRIIKFNCGYCLA